MELIIGASRNSKIGSKLIQWWMGTKFSHVYARWELKTQQRNIIYQASHGMVHFQSFDNFVKANTIVKEFTITLTDEQFKKFSIKCIDLAGESYSQLELLQIFICNISNGKIQAEDQPGYICSELICELLEDLGIKFDKPKFLMRPDDIIRSLEQHGFQSV